MNDNIIGRQIMLLRKKFGLTQEDLALKLGYSKQTISNWKTGLKTPRMGAIQKISDLFNVSKSFIIDGNQSSTTLTQINDTSAKLEDPRQKVVLETAQSQLQEKEKSNVINVSFGVKDTIEDAEKDVSISGKMTAGCGTMNFDKTQPIYTITINAKNVPYGYDLAFEVSGDSMYPTFEDGEIIFVKETTEVTTGMIGCVEINGDAFIKKMYVEDGRLRLVSLNNDYDENGDRIYPDFYSDDNDEIFIIGKAVM